MMSMMMLMLIRMSDEDFDTENTDDDDFDSEVSQIFNTPAKHIINYVVMLRLITSLVPIVAVDNIIGTDSPADFLAAVIPSYQQ